MSIKYYLFRSIIRWLSIFILLISSKMALASQPINSNELKVLAWNVGLIQTNTPQNNGSRAILIGSILNQQVADVLVLSELLTTNFSKALLASLRDTYPFQTTILATGRPLPPRKIFNGGVAILSKWRIRNEQELIFSDGYDSDALAAKGVKYARISKLGKEYHIFGTHTQAIYTPTHLNLGILDPNLERNTRAVRDRQIAEIAPFVSRLAVSGELAVIAGDLNVNFYDIDSYRSMKSVLQVEAPDMFGMAGRPLTYDPATNTSFSEGAGEWLDHVFYTTVHQRPAFAESRILQMKVANGGLSDPSIAHLSDHFAIETRFVMQHDGKCTRAGRGWSASRIAVVANNNLNANQIESLCSGNKTREAPVRCYRWLVGNEVDWNLAAVNWPASIPQAARPTFAVRLCAGAVFERQRINCINRIFRQNMGSPASLAFARARSRCRP